jgi:hypothetical protein
MIRKIIYINYQPFTSKFYQDFYIGECLKNGMEVEYWDLSQLYFPKTNFNEKDEFDIIVKKLNSLSELKIEIEKCNILDDIFVTNITYEFRVWKLFRILTNYKCKLMFFARGMFPTPNNSTSSKILEFTLNFNFKKIILGFKNKLSILFKKYKFIKTFDFVFRAGTEGGFAIGYGNNFDLKHAEIIEINYFDYDNYFSLINTSPILEGEYCVFIDQYLAFHPDIDICGLKKINPTIYYSELNKYFEFIEERYNLKVVIAAHPKAISYNTDNPFLGRHIIFGETTKLVKHAKFVLTHHSTAISYPILFKKPIVFLNSTQLKKAMPELHYLTIFLGNYLNCDVINYDEFDFHNELNLIIDNDKYKKYKFKYLTSIESQERFSDEIFIEKILSL